MPGWVCFLLYQRGIPYYAPGFPSPSGHYPLLQGAANSACWWQSPQAALSVTPWLGLTAHLQCSLPRTKACTQSTTSVFCKCPRPGKAFISHSIPRQRMPQGTAQLHALSGSAFNFGPFPPKQAPHMKSTYQGKKEKKEKKKMLGTNIK